MLQAYRQHVADRAALGIPPLPLSAQQTGELIELLKAPPAGEGATLVQLYTGLIYRGPALVSECISACREKSRTASTASR